MAEVRSLRQLASMCGGTIVAGSPDLPIANLAGLEDAGPGDLSFFDSERYRKAALASKADALLVREYVPACRGAQIQVPLPYLAFLQLVQEFYPESAPEPGVHPTAVVSESAVLGTGVSIGAHVTVEAGAGIGAGTRLMAGVYVGPNVTIGMNCLLYPNAVIWERSRLGNRVIVHAGAVIGDDGFGYQREPWGHRKIRHVGRVEIGDDVEIGSNTTIDRATFGRTVIGSGTKIDNLVQIGHNVQIGERVLIIAQAGLAGSSRVGADAILAGQTGIGDHAEIGAGAVLVAKSGVDKRARGGEIHAGSPIMPYKEWLKVSAALRYLPSLLERVRDLEHAVHESAPKRAAVER